MSSTTKHHIEIKMVCDRCGLSFTTTEISTVKKQGWLSLHTDEVFPEERFDLCSRCNREFREKFLGGGKSPDLLFPDATSFPEH